MDPDGSGRRRGTDDVEDGRDPLLDLTLSHYRIVARLGGGMGVVYKAEDTRLRRPVALKFISDELSRDPEALARFAREAQTASAASAAVLDGSIGSLGSQYTLALRAKNCSTGDILADEQAQVARKEDGSLSQMATQVRKRLGESLATVEKYSRPLQEATTASLDALKAFTTARQVYASSGRARAQPLFERAIAIDPDFAIAHAQLGIFLSNQGESALSRQRSTGGTCPVAMSGAFPSSCARGSRTWHPVAVPQR